MPTFIEPILTLSSHQKSKHETISKECSTLAHYFQLDFPKKDKERQELASSAIPVLQKKDQGGQLGTAPFSLFASLEELTLPIWVSFAGKLIESQILTLIFVDEAHSLDEFGLSLWKDFLTSY